MSRLMSREDRANLEVAFLKALGLDKLKSGFVQGITLKLEVGALPQANVTFLLDKNQSDNLRDLVKKFQFDICNIHESMPSFESFEEIISYMKCKDGHSSADI